MCSVDSHLSQFGADARKCAISGLEEKDKSMCPRGRQLGLQQMPGWRGWCWGGHDWREGAAVSVPLPVAGKCSSVGIFRLGGGAQLQVQISTW